MSSLSFRLDERVAIVTGGTRGIGKAIAMGLLGAGAQVIICGRDEERACTSARELAGATGRPAVGFGFDLTHRDQAHALVERTVATFRHIDILVNNAGIVARGPVESATGEEFQNLIHHNLMSTYYMCRDAAAHLKASGEGRVINIGSILSIVGMAERALYAATKGAVLQFTRSLALEWAKIGVTVNCILPGVVLTDLNRELLRDPEVERVIGAQIPIGRVALPDDIAGVAVFLASSAATYITGAAIPVDGGWTAR